MSEQETEAQLPAGRPLEPADYPLNSSDELQETLRASTDPSLSTNQQFVLALAIRGYNQFDTTETTRFRLIASGVFFLLAAIATFYFSVLLFGTLLPFDWLIVTTVITAHLFFANLVAMKRFSLYEEDKISIVTDNHRRGDHFEFGELDDVFDSSMVFGFALVLGALFGLQIAVLTATTSHMDVPVADSHVGSLLVTTNNLFHGALLDVMEIYRLRIGPETGVLPFWTATMFLFFRITFDGLLILFALNLWRVHKASRLFDSFPEQLNAANLGRWIHSVSNHESRFDRSFSDEMIFSFIIKEYILGRHDVVLATCNQFQNIPVSDEVRALFVDDSGRPLFAPRTPGTGSELLLEDVGPDE